MMWKRLCFLVWREAITKGFRTIKGTYRKSTRKGIRLFKSTIRKK